MKPVVLQSRVRICLRENETDPIIVGGKEVATAMLGVRPKKEEKTELILIREGCSFC